MREQELIGLMGKLPETEGKFTDLRHFLILCACVSVLWKRRARGCDKEGLEKNSLEEGATKGFWRILSLKGILAFWSTCAQILNEILF